MRTNPVTDPADVLAVAGIALVFASQPETVGVFAEWARKSHEELRGGPCEESGCVLHKSAEEWRPLLNWCAHELHRALMLNGGG